MRLLNMNDKKNISGQLKDKKYDNEGGSKEDRE